MLLGFLKSLLLFFLLLCLLLLRFQVPDILNAQFIELVNAGYCHFPAGREDAASFLQVFEMLREIYLVCLVDLFLLKLRKFGMKEYIGVAGSCHDPVVVHLHP